MMNELMKLPCTDSGHWPAQLSIALMANWIRHNLGQKSLNLPLLLTVNLLPEKEWSVEMECSKQMLFTYWSSSEMPWMEGHTSWVPYSQSILILCFPLKNIFQKRLFRAEKEDKSRCLIFPPSAIFCAHSPPKLHWLPLGFWVFIHHHKHTSGALLEEDQLGRIWTGKWLMRKMMCNFTPTTFLLKIMPVFLFFF